MARGRFGVSEAPDTSDPLLTIARNLWPNLPALLVSSAWVCAAGGVVALAAPGLTPISVLLWGLLACTAFSGLIGQVVDLAAGREIRSFSYWRYLRRTWRLGLGAWALPAVAACVFLIGVRLWSITGNGAAAVSMAASGLVGVLSAIQALVAVPLGLRLPGVRGWRLAFLSLHTVARRPVPLAGALAVLVLVLVAAVRLSASVLFLLPGLFAVVLVAGTLVAAQGAGIWRPDSGRASR